MLFIDASLDNTVRVWDLETENCVGIHASVGGSVFSVAQSLPILVAGTDSGRIEFLQLVGPPHGAPLPLLSPRITTAVRLWLFSPEVTGGQWDDAITAICGACCQRLSVPAATIDAIGSIARTARLGSGDSPCLKLPADVWDDPQLLSECPLCHEPLKLNPFVVDNKPRHWWRI